MSLGLQFSSQLLVTIWSLFFFFFFLLAASSMTRVVTRCDNIVKDAYCTGTVCIVCILLPQSITNVPKHALHLYIIVAHQCITIIIR